MSGQIMVDPDVKPRGKFPWKTVIFVLLIVAIVVSVRFYQKREASQRLKQETVALDVINVSVVKPVRQDAVVTLLLPGTVQAFKETQIYARTDGYLKHWYFDIGAKVKKGELLAEIDAPEVDQQLNQAKAALLQVQADLELAQSTADRWEKMFAQDAVSKQNVDEKKSDLQVKQASLAANQADVKRLEELQSFEKIYMPFDGIITQRNVDVGALVSEGSGTSVQELFNVAQIDMLRIYVNIPERYSGSVTEGTPARIEFASRSGELVEGKVVRTANAIDPKSLTMLTEIDIDNAEGKFLPGGYAQVHIDIHMQNPPLLIPANTLLFRSQGAQVGVVDANNKVKLVAIKIQRDFGTKLEITGISEDDSVILNPSDSISNGQTVQVVKKIEK
jgi:membrane fusion protein, multidrug efflux system